MSDAIFLALPVGTSRAPPDAAKLLPGRMANGSEALLSGDFCCESVDATARPKKTDIRETRLKMRIKNGD
jgi:hypothetical protein